MDLHALQYPCVSSTNATMKRIWNQTLRLLRVATYIETPPPQLSFSRCTDATSCLCSRSVHVRSHAHLTGGVQTRTGFSLLFNGRTSTLATQGQKESLLGKTDAFRADSRLKMGRSIDYEQRRLVHRNREREFGKDVTIKVTSSPAKAATTTCSFAAAGLASFPRSKGSRMVNGIRWDPRHWHKIEHKVNGESVRKATTTPAKPKDEKTKAVQSTRKIWLIKSSTFMIRAPNSASSNQEPSRQVIRRQARASIAGLAHFPSCL